jgi:glycosyltransferase involved in cell wall biosynthesis
MGREVIREMGTALLRLLRNRKGKPKLLLLADRRGGAFEMCANGLARNASDLFHIEIKFVHEKPRLDPSRYDLLYVFFWGENYHQNFGFDVEKTVKEISSHRWQDDPRYGPCSPVDFVSRYLADAGNVICTSRILYDLVAPHRPRVFHAANGYDERLFYRTSNRNGKLRIGWAGNLNDRVKGVREILEPACKGRFELVLAPGEVPPQKMKSFYNSVDICAISSLHEGTPLPLLESMASGCFPVATNVGVVPELITHGVNGFIVEKRTPAAFSEAFAWCEANLSTVRIAGEKNSRLIRDVRTWTKCANAFFGAIQSSLEFSRRPKFRNDDVSPETPLNHFRRFCEIFQKHGYTQIHGITLRGRTHGLWTYDGDEAQYPGVPSIARVPNDEIRKLSETVRFEDAPELIAYLNQSEDELALHGLYHTDYSTMTAAEQKQDMVDGLILMKQLFPTKSVRYFIAPFNRTNEDTFRVAAELGLIVFATQGIHLESELAHVTIQPSEWYRYHHHRFYPESTFKYYPLSLERLEAAFSREQSSTCE